MRITGLLLVALGCSETARVEPPPVRNPERFLFLAVLEGLYEEGVDPALAAALIGPDRLGHFVDKCPLCEPVRFAFETYAAHPQPRMYAFQEVETPAALREGLASPDRRRRLTALRDLIDRYVARKVARSALTEKGLEGLRRWLARARQAGMSFKRGGFGDFCPSCDGAALNR